MLTLARDLRRRKARERTGAFVAEGVRAVEELLQSSLEVRGALVSTALGDAPVRAALERRGVPITEVDEPTFATAADTESPQGVLAVATVPERGVGDIPTSGRVLALDGVQDPGNVGAIIRSAAAFGMAATIALPGTVDLWNAKVVRSAMGAHFVHLAFAAPWEALDRFRAASGMPVWAADAQGDPIGAPIGASYPDRLVLVVGNEGNGLSAEARDRADRLVSIPVRQVESLNVAVATGILLYELRA
jgi:RNA methyltransferase, TrmH family